MAQGKMKTKSNLPKKSKVKLNKPKKGKAVTKRPNAPVKSKKLAGVEKNKMKATVTKMVNAAAEKQLRSLSKNTPQLSEAQKRVAAAPTAPGTSKSKKK